MILYHFTSPDHLPYIVRDGLIKVGESNVGSPKRSWAPYGEHIGPDVVWLLDTTDLGSLSHGLDNEHHDKTAVRITVDLDDAVRWMEWEPRLAMNTKWRAAFLAAGGGLDAADHWWVTENPVEQARWVSLERRADNEKGGI